MKRVLVAPSAFLPLLGPAYLRACESSCDRYGAYVADNLDGAVRAMLTLGDGKQKERPLDAAAFAAQYQDERGFFVSWHELSSAYPTLCQRTAQLLALKDPLYSPKAPRNPFAYLLALLTPGGQLGAGGSSAIVFMVAIGLMAAMAIPAFQKVRSEAGNKACYNNTRIVQSAYEQCELTLGHAPTRFEQFIGPGKAIEAMPKCLSGGEYSVEALPGVGCKVTCSVHGVPETRKRR